MYLPPLQPSGRDREFRQYSDLERYQTVVGHLMDGLTHREMDERFLGLDSEKSKGYQSMGILHYLGLKKPFQSLFKGFSLEGMIEELKGQEGFETILAVLSAIDIGEYKALEDLRAEEIEEGKVVYEGREKYYYGKRYERDALNRKRAIEIHGVNCIVCNFNFEAVYGERGRDYIEIHHLKPLSTLNEPMRVDAETDLVPVCSNCHRMIHRRAEQVLLPDQLRQLMNNR